MRYLLTCFLFTFSLFANDIEIDDKLFEQKKQRVLGQIELLSQRALNDDAEAFFELGKIYFENEFIHKDYIKSLKYFNAAYYLDHKEAAYYLGLFHINSRTNFYDPKKALSYFIELARKGHAASQNRVGMFLTAGIVLEKDYIEAVKWYEKSSKQGYIDAQCNLGFMYAAGKGVWKNMGRAHAFVKPGYEMGSKLCKQVWDDYSLSQYIEDKGFKFKFYNEP